MHVGCFQDVSIVNDAEINILVHMYFLIVGCVSSGWIYRRGVAELKSLCDFSSERIYQFAFPPTMSETFLFPQQNVLFFFKFCPSDW